MDFLIVSTLFEYKIRTTSKRSSRKKAGRTVPTRTALTFSKRTAAVHLTHKKLSVFTKCKFSKYIFDTKIDLDLLPVIIIPVGQWTEENNTQQDVITSSARSANGNFVGRQAYAPGKTRKKESDPLFEIFAGLLSLYWGCRQN